MYEKLYKSLNVIVVWVKSSYLSRFITSEFINQHKIIFLSTTSMNFSNFFCQLDSFILSAPCMVNYRPNLDFFTTWYTWKLTLYLKFILFTALFDFFSYFKICLTWLIHFFGEMYFEKTVIHYFPLCSITSFFQLKVLAFIYIVVCKALKWAYGGWIVVSTKYYVLDLFQEMWGALVSDVF